VPSETAPAAETSEPSACFKRLQDAGVRFSSLPDIVGPGECGATDVVLVQSIRTAIGSSVALTPTPTVRCEMAEAFARWVREDVAPALETPAARLTGASVDASFECRGRNRVVGAKISQHGFGNAIDVNAFSVGGKVFRLTDFSADKELRTRIKEAACARFTTVLGPGSDGYHESHVHLDIIERRGGFRLCQWDVRDKEMEMAALEAETAETAAIPMPKPKPAAIARAPAPGPEPIRKRPAGEPPRERGAR
jgi:hypothetical protein